MPDTMKEVGMLGIHSYWLFLVSGILLNLAPGQDTMFIIGRSLTGGVRAGIAATLGVAVGCAFHALAAAFGLSAVLATSATAFTVVKLVGAAYLLYLGARLLLTKTPGEAAFASQTAAATSPQRCFTQGVLTNVMNPKVALFFLAFLPQFIEPTSTTKTWAFLALGGTFIATGITWCLILVVGAARVRGFFQSKPKVRTLLDRVIGALFIALGVRLAWASR